jgi:hypothetical protein
MRFKKATWTTAVLTATILFFTGCTKKSSDVPILTPLDGTTSANDSAKRPDASAPQANNSVIPPGPRIDAPVVGVPTTVPTQTSEVARVPGRHHGKQHRRRHHGRKHHGRHGHHGKRHHRR